MTYSKTLNLDPFNNYYLVYHDAIRGGQEPYRVYSSQPKIAPAEKGNYSFEIVFHLDSGKRITPQTPRVRLTL